jgi:hypothetical protein
MKRWAGFAVIGLVACGGTNWKGVYTGEETNTESCDGSVPTTQMGTDTFDIGVSGNQIFWPTACGVTVRANIKGDVATIVPISCLPAVQDGVTATVTFTGGTLTLDNNTLTENITATTTATTDGGALNCTATLTGTFPLTTL